MAGVYDAFVVDPCHSDWADYVTRRWHADRVERVLDVCCGTGLMTQELLARGLDVVGIDASPEMLDLARAHLPAGTRLEQAVLPDLPPGLQAGIPFDAAVSTLDGLNYLDLPGFRASLAAIAACLRPGGWLVIDLHAEPTLDFARANTVLEGEQDGTRFTLTTTVDEGARACRTVIDLRTPDDEGSFTEEHVQYVHSDAQVRTALADAGFEDVTVTDEYTDDAVTAATLRATWVARRASA